jgi:pSer/pThr/pTyr-binding forkhead associated (FHA) protein
MGMRTGSNKSCDRNKKSEERNKWRMKTRRQAEEIKKDTTKKNREKRRMDRFDETSATAPNQMFRCVRSVKTTRR